MEIKVMQVNPVGYIEKEEIIELTFVEPVKRELINGIFHEPMKKERFVLEIGDFTYDINRDNGKLEELRHLRKGNTTYDKD